MGVIASLQTADITVEPGEEARCEVRLRNTGTVVDRFTLDVLGEAKEWITVSPAEVSVFPGDDATAELTFRPPRAASTPNGSVRFALRVMSWEDTEGSTVEEATVNVGTFTDLTAELLPRTTRGRWRARTRLAVDNRGNSPASVTLSGLDEDGKLRFVMREGALRVDPDTSRIVPVRLRVGERFLVGPPRTVPYQLLVRGPENNTVTADGALVQLPLLPARLPKALVLATAGLVLACVLGPAYFKPSAHSAAVTAPPQDTGAGADNATHSTSPAPSGRPSAQSKPDEASASTPPPPSPGPSAERDTGREGGSPAATAKAPAVTGKNSPTAALEETEAAPEPVSIQAEDFRIETTAAPGRPGEFKTFEHKVPKGQTLYISDFMLENPHRDTGTLQIRRNGAVLMEYELSDVHPQLDRHFLEPLRFEAGQRLVLAVDCRKPGRTACTPAAFVSGRSMTPAE
ncbi:hypothetical protein [Streptomyces sp. TRM70350]|uniref:COG1470 family protein n=1 Tax=Streptomyces sp. TRM70350 TaxID=2856165 RepID=UPI001C4832A4|nr:hypothetical protein [Streptomyces sp. TRM70350]MBV7696558.1 hypothetical protein [Streptomyces sp. TRM70350]